MRRFLEGKHIVEFCLVGWTGLGADISLALAESAAEHAPTLTSIPSLWGEFFKILAVLGGLLGGLLLILHFWRQPFWSKKHSPATKMIQVLATHYLEPRKSLVLVQVGGQQFLLANTMENLTFLTEVEYPDFKESLFNHTSDRAAKHDQKENEPDLQD